MMLLKKSMNRRLMATGLLLQLTTGGASADDGGRLSQGPMLDDVLGPYSLEEIVKRVANATEDQWHNTGRTGSGGVGSCSLAAGASARALCQAGVPMDDIRFYVLQGPINDQGKIPSHTVLGVSEPGTKKAYYLHWGRAIKLDDLNPRHTDLRARGAAAPVIDDILLGKSEWTIWGFYNQYNYMDSFRDWHIENHQKITSGDRLSPAQRQSPVYQPGMVVTPDLDLQPGYVLDPDFGFTKFELGPPAGFFCDDTSGTGALDPGSSVGEWSGLLGESGCRSLSGSTDLSGTAVLPPDASPHAPCTAGTCSARLMNYSNALGLLALLAHLAAASQQEDGIKPVVGTAGAAYILQSLADARYGRSALMAGQGAGLSRLALSGSARFLLLLEPLMWALNAGAEGYHALQGTHAQYAREKFESQCPLYMEDGLTPLNYLAAVGNSMGDPVGFVRALSDLAVTSASLAWIEGQRASAYAEEQAINALSSLPGVRTPERDTRVRIGHQLFDNCIDAGTCPGPSLADVDFAGLARIQESGGGCGGNVDRAHIDRVMQLLAGANPVTE